MVDFAQNSYTNLDYLLVSSELPSYNSIEHYLFDHGKEDYRTDAYDNHQSYTLGFLEQAINTASRGEYDAIRPMCINGRPAYMYINSNDELSQLIQPLSPLYQPVVISSTRYEDEELQIPESTLSIDIQSTLLDESYTQGIDASSLMYYELERGYQAKIPLFSDEFKYPISKITIDVLTPVSNYDYSSNTYFITYDSDIELLSSIYFTTYVSGIELSSSQYSLEGGNLFFYSPIDDIILSAFNFKALQDEFIELTQNWDEGTLFYRVNIHFSQVIADTSMTSGVIDTVSNEDGRNALAQTTQYLISDYFNVFTLAESYALGQAEMDYIVQLTTLSTLISSVVLLPVVIASAAASGLSQGINKMAEDALTTTISSEVARAVGMTLLKYIASIPVQVMTEVFEELYIDTLIEETFEKWGDSTGFWSSLFCSFREVIFGAPSAFLGSLSSDTNINTQMTANEIQLLQEIELMQEHSWFAYHVMQESTLDHAISEDVVVQSQLQINNINQLQAQLAELGLIRQRSSIKASSIISSQTIFQGIFSLPGFFVGGFSLGFTGMLLDLSVDYLFDVQLARHMIDKRIQTLTQTQHQLDLEGEDLGKVLEAEVVPNIPEVKNVLAMAKGIATIDPTQYSASEFEAQVQLRLNELDTLGSYIESMRERQQEIEESHNIISAIPKTVIPDAPNSDTLQIVVSEEAAIEADPVIDVGGIKLWIQPLPANYYGSEKDMTLNELLTIMGILNHPYKWLSFTDQYGNQYILRDRAVAVTDEGFREIRGDLSLKEVFNIIGYDTSTLPQQFHGIAPSLEIKTDLINMPSWMFDSVQPLSSHISVWASALPGYAYIKAHFQHHFKGSGNFDMIFNTYEKAQLLETLYNLIIKPLRSKFLMEFDFGKDGAYDIENIKNAFKGYFERMWKGKDVRDSLGVHWWSLNKKKVWGDFINELFDMMFEKGFDPIFGGGLNYIQYVLEERITLAILDVIMRESVEICDSDLKLNTFSVIPQRLSNFISDYFDSSKTTKNDIEAFFFGSHTEDGKVYKEYGKTHFFNLLATTFFSDQRTDRMVIPTLPTSFFGYRKEAMYFFYELPLVMAGMFVKEDFNLENFYDHIEYSFDDQFFTDVNELILDGIDISNIFPSSSRWPDLNVYEFLSTVISHHMKSTYLQRFSAEAYGGRIRADCLSGLVIDFYKQIMSDTKILPEHVLELILPARNINEASIILNKIIHKGRNELNYETNFESLYQGKTYKVPSQHVYLFKVTSWLNQLIQETDRSITNIRELREFIEDIFDDPDFYNGLLDLVEEVLGQKFKQEEIFSQGFIGDVFCENIMNLFKDNLNKLVVPDITSNKGFSLSWSAYVDIWFDTNKEGKQVIFTSSMLDASTIFLFEDGVKKELPKDHIFKQAMVVVHNDNGDNMICPIDQISNLPDHVHEGLLYRDRNGAESIYHNIYVCNENGDQLFGKVYIDDNGYFAIDNLDWPLMYLTAPKVISTSQRFSKLQDSDINIYSTHFYTAVGYATGNRYITTLQKTLVNVIPNPVYKSYLPNAKARNRGVRIDHSIPILGSRQVIELSESFNTLQFFANAKFGEEFLYKTYLSLIGFRDIIRTPDDRAPSKRSSPIVYINDKIGFLNIKYDPYSGAVDLKSYRDKSDIEGIFNVLFNTKEPVMDFLFLKEEDGSIIPRHGDEVKIKTWLHNLFNKITDQQLNLGSERISLLIKEVRDNLLSKYTQNPIDITSDSRNFLSLKEIEAGKFIYEQISLLFGHFTLRLLYMRMIDFYGNSNSFKIDFRSIPSVDDILIYLNDFSIITSNQQFDDSPISSEDSVFANDNLFSYLFLDSFLVLPVLKGSDLKNRISFGNSPLIFLESDINSLLSRRITGEYHRTFYQRISKYFFNKYNTFLQSLNTVDNFQTYINRFINSGWEMFNVIKNELKRNVYSRGDLALKQKVDLYNRLLISAEKEIFDYGDHTVLLQGNHFHNIRFQTENLIIGWSEFTYDFSFGSQYNVLQREIIFWQVNDPITGDPFTLPIEKTYFDGKDIFIWRGMKFGKDTISKKDFNSNQYNQGSVEERADILRNVIEDNFGVDGSVRIYPLYRPNPDLGYHFLLRTDFASNYIPNFRQPLTSGLSDARRFDINLNDPDVQYKLEHIARLSPSFVEPGYYAFAKDFLFIMTLNDIGDIPIYQYDKMVCAFDRNKFYSPEEIPSFGDGVSNRYKPVKITNTEDGVAISRQLIKLWTKERNYIPISTEYAFPDGYHVWW
ncbi:MAG: hypothetical protein CEE43_09475 [Promethearchaeota archaeon Loki_b32]|nr:MAG: hypothetical protein CEE43_09475 [Candidatus Lokiarchaeota archaeon Loki_b32]